MRDPVAGPRDGAHRSTEAARTPDPDGWRARLRADLRPCLRTTFVSGTLVLAVLIAIPTVLVASALIIFRHTDPPGSMLMATQRLSGQRIDQRWVALPRISPALVRAVIASEDGQFCRHDGIDRSELAAVIEQVEGGDDPTRGGSTITMQVAKNMFLWNSRSIARKALEIPIALAIERLWSKERIMEVYLNIAEWGQGVFGAEAAAQLYFRKPASRLTEREAALLAAALPNPLLRVPTRPNQHMLKVAGVIESRARIAGPRSACVLAPRR